MSRRVIIMQALNTEQLIETITTVVGWIVALGLIAKNYWDHRDTQKKVHVEDENAHNNSISAASTAASELANILRTVVSPLADQVKLLEQQALERQKQIIDIQDQLITLERMVKQKDEEIDRLTKESETQKNVIMEQNQKIKDQADRIQELECEVKLLKERGSHG